MNVIWFVIDTLRSDHLGCYGYFRDTSPNIDRIAAEGLLYKDSYASAIATGPGFTSLFTGLSAINHGFYLTPWNVPNKPLLDDTIPTLPEIIQTRGAYTTAAFDNLINFRSHMKQFVRGFEFYTNITRSPGWLHHHILADEVNYRLLPWLDHHHDEQFFAFVHYWDPHTPYNMPGNFRGRHNGGIDSLEVRRAADGYEYVPGWGLPEKIAVDGELNIHLYDDEVYYVDHCIGDVCRKLEELEVFDETVIVITGDHGEDLDVHGLWGHGTVHETTIRVPFIIRDPAIKRPETIGGFVQHADNLPTILRYFPETEKANPRLFDPRSLPEIGSDFDGSDVVSDTWVPREEIVVESGAHRAVLAPPWKLIWYADGSRAELFNTENDPLELNDRAEEQVEISSRLQRKLDAWVVSQLKQQRSDPIHSVDGAWTCYIGNSTGKSTEEAG